MRCDPLGSSKTGAVAARSPAFAQGDRHRPSGRTNPTAGTATLRAAVAAIDEGGPEGCCGAYGRSIDSLRCKCRSRHAKMLPALGTMQVADESVSSFESACMNDHAASKEGSQGGRLGRESPAQSDTPHLGQTFGW